jgi:hypothetical protein
MNTIEERVSLQDLFKEYFRLENEFGWTKEEIYSIAGTPVYCFKSPQKGQSLWILSGVHGEEIAGPIAISRNIDNIAKIALDIPMIVIPLLNPDGYRKGWRYPNEYRDWHKGQSVTDSEYLLIDRDDKARAESPSSEIAEKVTKYILNLVSEYPPILTLDHHEDEQLEKSYIYSQGKLGASDPIAIKVVSTLLESGIPLQMTGKTRFDENIVDGIVENAQDGSVDELLSTEKIIVDNIVVRGPSAKTSLVIETPTIGVSLEERINAHGNILKRVPELWRLVKN